MKTVTDTKEASSMQGLDMAEREPREGTMLGGGSAGASMVPGRTRNLLRRRLPVSGELAECH